LNQIDIVIPVYNELDRLIDCIDSIQRHTPQQHNIILVNDNSDDLTIAWMMNNGYGRNLITNRETYGFGYSANRGLQASQSRRTALLNSDTIVTRRWLSTMMKVADLGFDIVGPSTSHSNGQQCLHDAAGERFRWSREDIDDYAAKRFAEYDGKLVDCDIFGFCYLIDNKVIDAIGGFDHELYKDGYYEDWDYVKRAQAAGLRTAWAQAAYVHHFGASSSYARFGQEEVVNMSARNEKIFKKRVIEIQNGERLKFPIGGKA